MTARLTRSHVFWPGHASGIQFSVFSFKTRVENSETQTVRDSHLSYKVQTETLENVYAICMTRVASGSETSHPSNMDKELNEVSLNCARFAGRSAPVVAVKFRNVTNECYNPRSRKHNPLLNGNVRPWNRYGLYLVVCPVRIVLVWYAPTHVLNSCIQPSDDWECNTKYGRESKRSSALLQRV